MRRTVITSGDARTPRPAEAVDRISQLADPAPVVLSILESIAQSKDPIADLLVVASVLADRPIPAERAEVLQKLLETLILRPQAFPRSPEEPALLLALESIQKRLQAAHEAGDQSVPSVFAAQLLRARARLAMDGGENELARALVAEALEAFQNLNDWRGVVVARVEAAFLLRHGFKDLAGAAEHLLNGADVVSENESLQQRTDRGIYLIDQLLELTGALHRALNFPLAVRAARRVTELAPDRLEAWRILGNALAQQQQYESAIKAFRHLVERDPTDETAARANLAVADAGRTPGRGAGLNQ